MTDWIAGEVPTESVLIENLPAEIYHSWKAASSSTLKHFRKSDAHALRPVKVSEAMLFGDRVDTLLLTPERFKQFRPLPKMDMRTNAGKEAKAALLELVPDESYLIEDYGEFSWTDIFECAKAVHAHEEASTILGGRTDVQLSGVWYEKGNPIPRKFRTDILSRKCRYIADLKVVSDASYSGHSAQIYKMGWHIQAAMYREGCARLGIETDAFFHIAVENKPPFGPERVAVYELDEQTLLAGRAEMERYLKRYDRCVSDGKWSGYRSGVISLPTWAIKAINEGDEHGNGHAESDGFEDSDDDAVGQFA